MARRGTVRMSQKERLQGTIFFVFYLLFFPLLFPKVLQLLELLLNLQLSAAAENAIYYYLIFALTLLIFYRYLWQNCQHCFDHLGRTLSTAGIGLICFYGGNELIYRLSHLLLGSRINLNDVSIAAQINTAPRMTAFLVIVLAPFVEEVLFRGLVFGCLRERSRLLAYLLSALLFALLHVLRFFLSGFDPGYLVLMLQYLVPGLIFAWAAEHSGNLWGAILLHMMVNALSVWVMLN